MVMHPIGNGVPAVNLSQNNVQHNYTSSYATMTSELSTKLANGNKGTIGQVYVGRMPILILWP